MILGHLMTNEEYTRKVLPFLKIKYFEGIEHQIVFDEIDKFVDKYSELPTKEAPYHPAVRSGAVNAWFAEHLRRHGVK